MFFQKESEGLDTGPAPARAINRNNDGEPYSLHLGGITILGADGSVAFLRESVTVGLVATLLTKF
jgi:hypothetical protein